jgi:hypothetical protein
VFEIQNHRYKPRWLRWFHPIWVNRDNAKPPVEEFRNDSSGIIRPHGPSTERTQCPRTVYDAETVRGHAVHPFQRPNGRGWSPETPKSQRNRTKHPIAPVLIVGTTIDVVWGCTLFLRDSKIPDPTSQVNPDPTTSPGVRETNTSPILIREFWVKQTEPRQNSSEE